LSLVLSSTEAHFRQQGGMENMRKHLLSRRVKRPLARSPECRASRGQRLVERATRAKVVNRSTMDWHSLCWLEGAHTACDMHLSWQVGLMCSVRLGMCCPSGRGLNHGPAVDDSRPRAGTASSFRQIPQWNFSGLYTKCMHAELGKNIDFASAGSTCGVGGALHHR